MTPVDRPLRVCHYYARAFEIRSGVTGALASWAGAQVDAGEHVTIIGAPSHQPVIEAYPSAADVLAVPHWGRGRGTWVPRSLRPHLQHQDVLVLHEGWTPSTSVAARIARKAGVPYVVVPHGVYEPQWVDLLRAAWARSAAESRVLRGAAAVHLFFESESDPIRRLAPAVPLITVPTGCRLPAESWRGQASDWLLWIGRYSIQHKGLDLLLEALAMLPDGKRPKLVMRGVDEFGEKRELELLVERLGLRQWVQVGGPVFDDEKTELLLSCAGYVQPSRWECHSVGLLDALAHGVPSLVSSTMHIAPDLRRRGGAIVVAPDPSAIGPGLAALAGGAAATGESGRRYVGEYLSWARIIEDYRRQLRTVLGSGRWVQAGEKKGQISSANR